MGSSPLHERDRLAALAQTRLLDTGPEAELDAVVALAAHLLATPMASMTLVDDHRQWFKAKIGLTHAQDPRSESLCAVAVDRNEPLVVPDARLDPRFAHIPAVRRGAFVSYAGVPISGRDGLPLGTLCVLDVVPRAFDPAWLEVLRSLAQLLGDQLDLRRLDGQRGIDSGTARHDTQELSRAVARDQLRVHYQPIVDLRSGRVDAVEALVRWQHPTRGLLTPDAFLPLAEAAGLVHIVDRWVLRTAVTSVARWRRLSPSLRDLRVAVNISVGPFLDEVWAHEVQDVLTATGLPPAALTVEVTERSLSSTSPESLAALEVLIRSGCHVAIDDLGTGTSSLALLADIPATELKIDRSFVQSMATDPRRAALVRAMACLGSELGLDVVAEGVEDRRTAEMVTEVGCTHGQGYLWSAPRDVSGLLTLLLP
ncbi:sensor domain-containing phosphodiesterase [Cellulomonas aerilata]|uniref:EAL domain-containing protein n=1 Tax=Cellulomonas aerilata TaxID=515326 RepID=A0A512DCH3_9CELL|nr:EAL domain-containing protein [Cellulomonas aerilata]GEO34155.1 hypothetical protein CAE01nite_18800 [Cellulomonas aerilata]